MEAFSFSLCCAPHTHKRTQSKNKCYAHGVVARCTAAVLKEKGERHIHQHIIAKANRNVCDDSDRTYYEVGETICV
jgi:hypothetical protein